MNNYDFLRGCLPTKECKICGKKFIANPNWMYKIHKGKTKKEKSKLNYYCSYTCYRKAGGDGGVQVTKYGK